MNLNPSPSLGTNDPPRSKNQLILEHIKNGENLLLAGEAYRESSSILFQRGYGMIWPFYFIEDRRPPATTTNLPTKTTHDHTSQFPLTKTQNQLHLNQ